MKRSVFFLILTVMAGLPLSHCQSRGSGARTSAEKPQAPPVADESLEAPAGQDGHGAHASRGMRPWNAPEPWENVLLAARVFLGPLPDKMPGGEKDTDELRELGRMLYFERGISLSKTQSCNECHPVDQRRAGADNVSTSKGAMGSLGKRNSPTVLNAGFQTAQFWDGRAADLAEQAKGPILNPVEMGMPDGASVIARVRTLSNYEESFRKAFPGQSNPFVYDNIGLAIAAFERTLVSPSRFDRLMRGQDDALTAVEKLGLQRFIRNGCIECHSGATVGGQLFRKIGEYHPYDNTEDKGLFGITKNENDLYVFKVPLLRNVALTAPYFHDGRIPTLPEAIHQMAWLQLDTRMCRMEIETIAAFLKSLSDPERVAVGDPPAGAGMMQSPPSCCGMR